MARRPEKAQLGGYRNTRVRLVADADHHEYLVQKMVLKANVSLWIATANVKEMMLQAPVGTAARARRRYLSILEYFDDLSGRGVEMRLLHAAPPSRAFRAEMRRHPRLQRGGLQMRLCPRVHLKLIVIDGALLYIGSANFTGAGLGAKGEGRRNFEMGVTMEDDVLLDLVQARFDAIWSGAECPGCRRRNVCPSPLDGVKD